MSQDWMKDCALEGARGAAEALGRILDRRLADGGPTVAEIPFSGLPQKAFPEGERVVAVFADLVGAATGQAGIVVSHAAALELVQSLLSEDESDVFSDRARSALSELGNIALSAACGEMAKKVRGVVMPSVPRLGCTLQEALLVDGEEPEMQHLPSYCADTVLTDASGPLPVRFVWLPF